MKTLQPNQVETDKHSQAMTWLRQRLVTAMEKQQAEIAKAEAELRKPEAATNPPLKKVA